MTKARITLPPPAEPFEAPSVYLKASHANRRFYRGKRKADVEQFAREVELARAIDARGELPPKWTPEHVGGRLTEAFHVIARLPADAGPAKLKTVWPLINRTASTAPRRTFANEEAWREALEDVAAQEALRDVAVWAFGQFRAPPKPAEITRADKVMRWSARFFKQHEGTARVLRVWIIAKARGRANGHDDLKKLCKKHKWAYSTFRRKVREALTLIADGLNESGEAVF